ncbi:hypothetical protein ACS0TY_019810 [Phlomoides rotata]
MIFFSAILAWFPGGSGGIIPSGLTPGDLVVDGGGAALETAGLHAGVDEGEEPKQPRGADEEEGGGGVPRLREAGNEHVENEEDSTGHDAQQEHEMVIWFCFSDEGCQFQATRERSEEGGTDSRMEGHRNVGGNL